MKQCINSACKAELEDYQERCPQCGWSQKKIEFTKSQEKKTDVVVVKGRHGFITFWLWLLVVVNILGALVNFFPKFMWGTNYPDEYVMVSVLVGVLGLLNVVGVFLLLMWKKVGFAIIAVSSTIAALMGLATMGTPPLGLIGLAILWFVLKIEKHGVSYWDAMKG